MAHDWQHYTATIAGLLAEQGHWPEAAEVYRHLVQTHPDREDLVRALAEAERHAQESAPACAADLDPLFAQWVGLMSKLQRMRRLQRFRRTR